MRASLAPRSDMRASRSGMRAYFFFIFCRSKELKNEMMTPAHAALHLLIELIRKREVPGWQRREAERQAEFEARWREAERQAEFEARYQGMETDEDPEEEEQAP